MQCEAMLAMYYPNLASAQNALGGVETNRFPNVELIESTEQPVYFDGQLDDADRNTSFYWSSPVQTYLELMRGDKRDRETAFQVREYILKRATRSG